MPFRGKKIWRIYQGIPVHFVHCMPFGHLKGIYKMEKLYIALATGVLVWYAKSCYEQAILTKLAAIKLRTNTLHFRRKMIEHNLSFLLTVGEKWVKEITSCKGDVNKILQIEERQKEYLQKKISELDTKEDSTKELLGHIDTIIANITKLEEKSGLKAYDMMSDELDKSLDRMFDGKTYISDAEAAHLGIYCSNQAYELKMLFAEIQETTKFAIFDAVVNADEKDKKEGDYFQFLEKLIWKGMLMSRCIVNIERNVEPICSQSNLNIAIRKFFDIF